MTEAYLGDKRVAVTKLVSYDIEQVREKTLEKDGYSAKIVSFGKTKKSGIKQYVREVRALATTIEPGFIVDVTALSKGKGTAGVMKRWNFAGGPRTHGQSDRSRAPGSIGQGTTPGRVLRGKHMAGRMGGVSKTIKNLTVVAVDKNSKSLWVAGPVPGHKGSLVTISLTDKIIELPTLKYLSGFNPEA